MSWNDLSIASSMETAPGACSWHTVRISTTCAQRRRQWRWQRVGRPGGKWRLHWPQWMHPRQQPRAAAANCKNGAAAAAGSRRRAAGLLANRPCLRPHSQKPARPRRPAGLRNLMAAAAAFTAPAARPLLAPPARSLHGGDGQLPNCSAAAQGAAHRTCKRLKPPIVESRGDSPAQPPTSRHAARSTTASRRAIL